MFALLVQFAPPLWRAVVTLTAITTVVLIGSSLDRPGEQPFADNPVEVSRSNALSVAEAHEATWPTRRNDSGPTGFRTYLGADLVVPGWVSCEDRICLVGTGNQIRVYDTYPRTAKVGEISRSAGRSPFEALTESTITEEQAARLLTP